MATKNEDNGQKKLSMAEKKKLFAEYEKADKTVTTAKATLEEAMAKRSVIVKQLAEGAGVGPFEYKGQILKIMKRTSKDDPEKATYYFRTESQQVEKIS